MRNAVGRLAIAVNNLNEAISAIARATGVDVSGLLEQTDEITADLVAEGYRRDAEQDALANGGARQ